MSTTSALTQGLSSPYTSIWPMIGDLVLIASSMLFGERFLPPAVMISSFLRPITLR